MMAGLPDITGTYQGYFFAIETKMPEGKEPTEIQKLRHAQIREAGGCVTVARTVREAVEFVLDVPMRHQWFTDGSGTTERPSRVCMVPACGCNGNVHP